MKKYTNANGALQDVIGDIFGSLLACDTCHHGVGMHDATGCRERLCSCTQDKDSVVHVNVKIATQEFQSQWLPESK